ncbi:MAG: sulfatase-like hydrolase/transferase [Clostridia bacterium]|nr:sulfatase-like hydrolase/transferase [Clostridia bacterium]
MKKPKIIIGVMLHDAGRQFGCYGARDAITPNIDAMAAEGVRFSNHFSTGTVCIPSRASVLTGKYLHNAEICFYKHGVETLPRVLKKAGFETWRCGFAEEKEYKGIAGGPYPFGDLDRSGVDLLGFDHSNTATRDAASVADMVLDILEKRDTDQPTFIAAAFIEAHSPYNLPVTDDDIDAAVLPPLLAQLPNVRPAKEMLARFTKAVTNADTAVGRITREIRKRGLFDDTLLYFSCDHGIDFPRAKQSCYDSGTGVPLIFWGGALENAGRVADGLSSHLDILPTLCELLDVTPPADVCGVSQLAQLEGKAEPREFCVSEVSYDNTDAPVRAIRTKDFKLLLNFNPGLPVATGNSFTRLVGSETLTAIYATPRPFEELYDLNADPCELDNRAGDPAYQEIKAELKAKLLAHLAATNDEILCANSVYSNASLDEAYSVWQRLPDGTFQCRYPN